MIRWVGVNCHFVGCGRIDQDFVDERVVNSNGRKDSTHGNDGMLLILAVN